MTPFLRPAVFLDRDGTINEERGHIQSPEDLILLPGVAKAIQSLNKSQYITVVVTNQSVIARGKCTEGGMEEINNRLQSLIGEDGASIDGIYYCPHYPDPEIPGGRRDLNIVCGCRKPEPGLIMKAAMDMNINLASSWMIGDATRDIEAGKKAGLRSILLSEEENSNNNSSVIPDATCRDLKDAVRFILDYPKD